MDSLNERFERGQAMRTLMAKGDPSHYTLPGIDQLAPDLKRIIDEALFGQVWNRPGLDTPHRCMSTMSALMALGQLPLLRRHIERSLNLGVTPEQVVEVFIQLTFYVGVPAVETAMRTTKEIFEERGIQFIPTPRSTTPADRRMSYSRLARRATNSISGSPLYIRKTPTPSKWTSNVSLMNITGGRFTPGPISTR